MLIVSVVYSRKQVIKKLASGKFWVFLENRLTHYTFCSAVSVLNWKYQFYYRVQTKYGSNLLFEKRKTKICYLIFLTAENPWCALSMSAVSVLQLISLKCLLEQNLRLFRIV